MNKDRLFPLHTLEDLAHPVAELIASLAEPLRSQGCIVFLNGQLGSGKTAFVQAFADTVGVGRRVQSPTFMLMKTYPVDCAVMPELKKIVHVDAYRLEPHHRETLHLERFIPEPGTLVFVEWPTAINLDKSLSSASVDFSVIDEDLREAEVRYPKTEV